MFQRYYQSMNKCGKAADYRLLKKTDKMENYEKWAQEQGVKISKSIYYPCEFKAPSGYKYNGIVALEPIQPNTVIMDIPSNAMINSRCAYYSELYSLFRNNAQVFAPSLYSQDNWHWTLIVILMYTMHEEAKGAKSKWYHYLQTFNGTDDIAHLWPEKDIREIQCKKGIEDALKTNRIFNASWKMIESIAQDYPYFFPKSTFNYLNYRKHWIYVYTHCLFSHSGLISLVPYAEFLNNEACKTCMSTCSSDDSKVHRQEGKDIFIDIIDKFDCPNFKYPQIKRSSKFVDAASELKHMEALLKERVLSEEETQELKMADSLYQKDENYHIIFSSGEETFEKGSQIPVEYELITSNLNLLIDFGFTIRDNIRDHSAIDLDIIKTYPNAQQKESSMFSYFSKLLEMTTSKDDLKLRNQFYKMGINIYFHRLSPSLFISQI